MLKKKLRGKSKFLRKMNELMEYVQKNYTLNAYNNKLGNGPAHYYTIPEFQGYIGFIAALHNKFCGQ